MLPPVTEYLSIYKVEGQVVYETVDLNKTQWLPCSKRACLLKQIQLPKKTKWKPSLKVVNSSDHSVEGYADYVTV